MGHLFWWKLRFLILNSSLSRRSKPELLVLRISILWWLRLSMTKLNLLVLSFSLFLAIWRIYWLLNHILLVKLLLIIFKNIFFPFGKDLSIKHLQVDNVFDDEWGVVPHEADGVAAKLDFSNSGDEEKRLDLAEIWEFVVAEEDSF